MRKVLTASMLVSLFFFSCKKVAEDAPKQELTNNDVFINKGVVVFNSMSVYLKVTENKNDEQQMLKNILKEENFASLSIKAPIAQSISLAGRSISNIDTSFASGQYSEYLLDILNQDKIVSINGYLIKVDMDNGFCSFVDATLYPDAYDDLKNNVLSNPHIMTFVNPDEPVTEVLEQMRNGTLTWADYQIQLAKAKGGQGICFKSGAKRNIDPEYEIIGGVYNMYTEVGYYKGFIHFELTAQADVRYGRVVVFIEPRTITGKFEWEGVCRGAKAGTYSYTDNSLLNRNSEYTVYSGGSALKTAKMTALTTISAGSGTSVSIGY